MGSVAYVVLGAWGARRGAGGCRVDNFILLITHIPSESSERMTAYLTDAHSREIEGELRRTHEARGRMTG